jgi:hypothetical protein
VLVRFAEPADKPFIVQMACLATTLERDFVRVPSIGAPCTGGRSYVRARHIATVITRLSQTL